jgi:hypothetical protein
MAPRIRILEQEFLCLVRFLATRRLCSQWAGGLAAAADLLTGLRLLNRFLKMPATATVLQCHHHPPNLSSYKWRQFLTMWLLSE